MYYLTASQAADALGVSKATLYAYTSRGRLRSEAVPGRPKERRYLRQDIERLRERKELRRDPAKAASRGLHWGSPVLDSAITLVEGGRFYYRGQDAVEWAETASLEQTAELLWEADPSEGLFARQVAPLRAAHALRTLSKDPLTLLQIALPLTGAADPAGYDPRPTLVRRSGARIVQIFGAAVAGGRARTPMHAALQAAWAPKEPRVAEVVRRALVLCADHELNASAFAARCAASTGASPYDAVAAALATLKGSRHGGATGRVTALFVEAGTPRRARSVLASRLRRGEGVPGFGHPLYPGGDPRAKALLRLAETGGDEDAWRLVRGVWRAASDLLQDGPNLDFALAALALTYRLPESAPLTLFALGRTAGWIAHAMEQYASGDLIRPRARYVGRAPGARDSN